MAHVKESRRPSNEESDAPAVLKQDMKTTSETRETSCGLGSFKPRCLQMFNNMPSFMGIYCLSLMVTSTANVLITSQVTTLEKQFNLSSTVSGFLVASNEIGYLATILVFSHFTRRVHIPRALAASSVMFGLSSLICVLPYLGVIDQVPSPPNDSGDNTGGDQANQLSLLCSDVPTNHSCQNSSGRSKSSLQVPDSTRSVAVTLIVVGMIFQGSAKSVRQPYMGIYIEDNVPRTQTALFFSVTSAVYTLGPALASMLVGVFNKQYVTLEETSMSPRDPRFIGAWWLGFVVFGCAALVFSVPVFCFPRRMTTTESHTTRRETRTRRSWTALVLQETKDLMLIVWRLVRNPVYACIILGFAIYILALIGAGTFLPKYVETQFNVSAAQANISLGILGLVSSVVGSLTSGWTTSRFKLSALSCLKLTTMYLVLANISLCVGLGIGCYNPVSAFTSELDGFHGNRTDQAGIKHCHQNCHCESQSYFPVCGSDDKSYFSPCRAGCQSTDGLMFSNCTCVGLSGNGTASAGQCEDCHRLNYFLVMIFTTVFFSTMMFPPMFISIIRFVEDKDKPVALGLNGVIYSVFGFFLGPILYGHLVDSTCLLWKPTCTSRGVCSLYDIQLFRLRYFGLSVALRVVSIFLLLIAIFLVTCKRRHVRAKTTLDAAAAYERQLEKEHNSISLLT